jgi:hypothetical protein
VPLFHIGYRRYEGERTSHARRWWPITRTGIAIAWRSTLLRRLVFVSFLPFLYFGWVFFIIGRITDPVNDPNSPFFELANEMLGRGLVQQLHEDPSVIREAVWAVVFGMFGTFVQLLIAGLVAAIAGPALIANDMRTRAFLIYFSRPVSRLDYVVGKAGVLAALMASVTLLPTLLLYVLSILFSPSFETIVQTAPVALSMTLGWIGVIVPAALVMLVLSSLTRQPRFAIAAWVVVCVFGPLAHGILQATRGLRGSDWTFMLSLPNSVHRLQLSLLDVRGRVEALDYDGPMHPAVDLLMTSDSPWSAGIWLALISIASLLFLLRRVDAPTRV